MRLPRIYHALNALIFLGIGVLCLFGAEYSARSLGIAFTSAQGGADFRATYGGMCFALGAFFTMVFLNSEWHRAGGWLGLFLFLGLGGARAYGIFFESAGTPLMWGFLVTEAVFTLASLFVIKG